MTSEAFRYAAKLQANGLSRGATLFTTADNALEIMRMRGEVAPDVAEYLTSLGTHPVMFKDGTVTAVTFEGIDDE